MNLNPCKPQFVTAINALLLAFIASMSLAQEKSVPSPGLPLYPLDCAVDKDGNAFVVDRNLHGLWKYADDKLSVFYEGSPKFRTPMNAPRCVAFDQAGGLLVGDSATRDIYRVSTDGKIEPVTGGKIGVPMDIAVSSDGTIYVADAELFRLVKIPPGKSEPELVANVTPTAVFVDSSDNVWVLTKTAKQVQIIADDGTSEVLVSERTFRYPNQIVVKEDGTAFISDGYSKAIWKRTKGGKPEIVVQGAPLDNPVGLALHGDEVIVTDPRARQIFKLNAEGKLTPWFEIKR